MRSFLVSIILLSLLLVATQAKGETSKGVIAVFPFENESLSVNVLSTVMPLVKAELQKRGFDLMDDTAVREFFVKHRLRQSGYVSSEMGKALREEYGISVVLVGCVIEYSLKKNPVVAVHARAVDTDTGEILWAGYSSATGEDFVGLFGFGGKFTMQALLPEVIQSLFSTFTIEPSEEHSSEVFRVAVLPFRNVSERVGAGSIVTYLYITELFNNPTFQPVEFGDIREAVVELKLRPKGEVDYTVLDALLERLDVDGFIIGAVDEYREAPNPYLPPRVSIAARLLDAHSKRLLWYDYSVLDGDDEIKILDFGKLRSVDRVAYRIIQKQLMQLEEQIWVYKKGQESVTAKR